MPDQFTAALELAKQAIEKKWRLTEQHSASMEGFDRSAFESYSAFAIDHLSPLAAELVRVSEENARLRKALESGAYPYPVEAGYGDVQERGPDGLSADECLRALEKR